MASLTELSLAEALDGMRAKRFSATELVRAYIAAQETCRPLNAYVVETPELALEKAKESDARYAKGTARPLEGAPLGVKDLFCTKGVPTTAGSRILKGFTPAYESTVTARLWHDGALMLGKLGMDEFAMGSSNTTSACGPVINPWTGPDPANASRKLVPGGSSGGAAAAVAARAAIAAPGTDTGGSIRQPAALCGLTGIKPTYGRCSRWGIVAFASSLDQAGPVARDVKDAALMLRSMAGHDPKDSTSVQRGVPDYLAALTGEVGGLRVGIPREYRVDGMPGEIGDLWERGAKLLEEAGAEVVEISLPHTKYALPAYYIVAPAEASSNLARYDGVRYGLRVPGRPVQEMYENTRAAGFGREVRRRVLIGTYVLSAGYYDAYYLKAQKVRTRIAGDFAQAFKTCDVILTPATPGEAFAIGEKEDDPVKMWLEDVFTVPVNMAGLPGLSLPAGLSKNGLPLGLQLIGRPFDEETVLRVGGALENAIGFRAVPPFHA